MSERKKISDPITLESPVLRGKTSIAAISIVKPAASSLRGCKLGDLLQMDVDALYLILPRITTPPLTKDEVEGLDPADLLAAGVAAGAFFIKKAPDEAKPESSLIE